MAPPAESMPVLVVSDRGRVLRVPLAEVLYLKAELKYVTLRTAQHSYVLDDALADLEQRLGPDFLRIHRNALVAPGGSACAGATPRPLPTPAATEVPSETWAVRLAPTDDWLPVSRRQLAAVRELLRR